MKLTALSKSPMSYDVLFAEIKSSFCLNVLQNIDKITRTNANGTEYRFGFPIADTIHSTLLLFSASHYSSKPCICQKRFLEFIQRDDP